MNLVVLMTSFKSLHADAAFNCTTVRWHTNFGQWRIEKRTKSTPVMTTNLAPLFLKSGPKKNLLITNRSFCCFPTQKGALKRFKSPFSTFQHAESSSGAWWCDIIHVGPESNNSIAVRRQSAVFAFYCIATCPSHNGALFHIYIAPAVRLTDWLTASAFI